MVRPVDYLFALLFLVVAPLSAIAEGQDPCDEGRGGGILRCSENRLAVAKKEMVETLTSLKQAINPRLTKALNASQKQWLKYANGYCSVAGNPFPDSPNSLSEQMYWNEASYNYCHMRLTQERNANLVRLLACITEGGSDNCS